MQPHENDLRIELIKTLDQIDLLIDSVHGVAKEIGCSPYLLKDTNGNFLLTPMVTGKAQILHAITLLNTKEK